MKTFSNKSITKQQFVDEIKKHQVADNFISGKYWDEDTGKGCAVGCSLNSIVQLTGTYIYSNDHSSYEEFLGVPEWVARVEDVIFEGLPEKKRKEWPLVFSKAVPEGVDLNQIKIPFIRYILEQNIKIQKEKLKNNPGLKEISKRYILVNKDILYMHKTGLAAELAAELVARSVAKSAELAAWAAWLTAESVESAESVKLAAFEKYAKKFISLLKGAK